MFTMNKKNSFAVYIVNMHVNMSLYILIDMQINIRLSKYSEHFDANAIIINGNIT